MKKKNSEAPHHAIPAVIFLTSKYSALQHAQVMIFPQNSRVSELQTATAKVCLFKENMQEQSMLQIFTVINQQQPDR